MLCSDLGRLIYLTYLAGNAEYENGQTVTLGSGGACLVSETGASTDFPTLNAYQTAYGGGGSDAFLVRFDIPEPASLGLLAFAVLLLRRGTTRNTACGHRV